MAGLPQAAGSHHPLIAAYNMRRERSRHVLEDRGETLPEWYALAWCPGQC